MNQTEYWFWLCNIPGIFQESLKKLLRRHPSPEEIFQTDEEQLLKEGLISEKQKEAMIQSKSSLEILGELEKLQKKGIQFIHQESKDFPEKLKQIPDAPYSLYLIGHLPDPKLSSVGMVGARACSEYGKKMAFRYAGVLAAGGVQIISGLAAGIDAESAKGALSGGGKTFAVLGSGVDVIYPAENMALYYEIIASGGGIISEYPIGTQPLAWQFPLRNRLISGLSDRLLVMEAKERSGTLITVRYALEQGRDIYALPGRVTDKTSQGCNQMIADGAGILLSPEYLLEEIYRKPAPEVLSNRETKAKDGEAINQVPEAFGKEEFKLHQKRTMPKKNKTPKRSKALDLTNLRSDLKIVYQHIGKRPISVQSLLEKTKETPEMVASSIAELELLGLIREVSKNHYAKIF